MHGVFARLRQREAGFEQVDLAIERIGRSQTVLRRTMGVAPGRPAAVGLRANRPRLRALRLPFGAPDHCCIAGKEFFEKSQFNSAERCLSA
jgi:hypothetical protein